MLQSLWAAPLNFPVTSQWSLTLSLPYVIYADFESLLIPIKGCETSKQSVVYRGLDAAEKVVEHVVMEQEDIEQKCKLNL
jgi:hypothetical protein